MHPMATLLLSGKNIDTHLQFTAFEVFRKQVRFISTPLFKYFHLIYTKIRNSRPSKY